MAAGLTLLLVKTLNFRENLNEVGIYSAHASRNFEMYIKYMIGLMAHSNPNENGVSNTSV